MMTDRMKMFWGTVPLTYVQPLKNDRTCIFGHNAGRFEGCKFDKVFITFWKAPAP